MTDCQFRACKLPVAGKGYLVCEHDVQHWCYPHMEQMRKMLAPDAFLTCGAYIDEQHPHGCGVQGLAADVYIFEWEKEGLR